mgnify:CR=1 FL=1
MFVLPNTSEQSQTKTQHQTKAKPKQINNAHSSIHIGQRPSVACITVRELGDGVGEVVHEEEVRAAAVLLQHVLAGGERCTRQPANQCAVQSAGCLVAAVIAVDCTGDVPGRVRHRRRELGALHEVLDAQSGRHWLLAARGGRRYYYSDFHGGRGAAQRIFNPRAVMDP